ncbi:MAG: hypothetical protein UW30_C0012G0002 [Candidatus Giovannonibacteria bacterium GW2011_GWA2_44_13b]|uniref:Uncharacterized protein n=1 Tax=Candidatus Giovannonibacteria bacterium GW2011_GWA2_44_13b TaxID=1618647 RepID=A0A0G1H0Y7_9BACT|nr:MAG: hypothetical protein UW30_C0012G0002 [Candidatus Giovannonibacteria bacterium GW2011_GWA2_44_13b]
MQKNQQKIYKLKIPLLRAGIFSVDLAGFEPASPSSNNGMLRTYTTGPGPRNYRKIEKAPLQELFLSHSGFARNFTNIPLLPQLYTPQKPCQYVL